MGRKLEGRQQHLREKDELMRKILRESAKGQPPSGPQAFRELTEAFGYIVEDKEEFDKLRNTILMKARLLKENLSEQVDDLIQDVRVKGLVILTNQYMNKIPKGGFRFDPDDYERPVWAWIHAIAGQGTGYDAGMLGAYLSKLRAERKRCFSADAAAELESSDGGDGVSSPFLGSLADERFESPEDAAQTQSYLARFLGKAESLPSKRRLPVTILLLWRMELLSAESLWRAVNAVLKQMFGEELPQTMSDTVENYKVKANGNLLTDADLLAMLAKLANVSERAIRRWFDDFVTPLAVEVGIKPKPEAG